MARVRAELGSLRFSRLESRRLIVFLLLSLLAHLLTWGVYETGKRFGWWQHLSVPAWARKAPVKKSPPPPPARVETEPTIFVDVSQADAEPPKQTVYYSSKNSRAANREADEESNQPKINGKQKLVPKTEDLPRLPGLHPSALPSSPTPPSPAPPSKPAPNTPFNPVDAMSLGDLKLARPDKPNPTAQPNQRPRTLKEALAQGQLPSEALQQSGGVHRRAVSSSLDAKATSFGAYDSAIVNAVTQHWYDLLDSHQFAQDRTGKVMVRFKLSFDGTVSEMEVLENTVGELLSYVCQEAISESAPFGQWPSDMRREIGANYREITFTFYYY
jgi:hypothetical protein